jgi:hypothetical protein
MKLTVCTYTPSGRARALGGPSLSVGASNDPLTYPTVDLRLRYVEDEQRATLCTMSLDVEQAKKLSEDLLTYVRWCEQVQERGHGS